jgi:hypothetical protein
MPKSIRKVFEIPFGNLKFPLAHPKFKIIDYHYGVELYKSGGFWESRFPLALKLERALRILFFKGPRAFAIKAKKYLKTTINYNFKKKQAIKSYKRKEK